MPYMGIEIAKLVVIGTDCTRGYKSNYNSVPHLTMGKKFKYYNFNKLLRLKKLYLNGFLLVGSNGRKV
jgi:hypothetical protein